MSSRGLNIRLIQIVTKLAMVYALVYEPANKSRRENNPDFSACSRTVKVFVAATATKSYCAIQPWLRFSIGHGCLVSAPKQRFNTHDFCFRTQKKKTLKNFFFWCGNRKRYTILFPHPYMTFQHPFLVKNSKKFLKSCKNIYFKKYHSIIHYFSYFYQKTILFHSFFS